MKLFEQFSRMQTLIQEGVLGDSDIKTIMRDYLACALWTEEEELNPLPDEPEEDDDYDEEENDMDRLVRTTANPQAVQEPISYTVDSFTDDSKIQAYLDIKKFIQLAGDDAVQYAIEQQGLGRLGHDIWLTRNHHGAGFFDHGYDDDIEQRLIQAGHALGEVHIFPTDEGQLSFSNEMNESLFNDLQPLAQHIKHTGLTVDTIKQMFQYMRATGQPLQKALEKIGATWAEVKQVLANHKPKPGGANLQPR